MTQIDETKPVLVTGANGYVASWLVKRLLDEGLTVHAAVRNPSDVSKVEHLLLAAEATKGKLKLFKADLLTKGSYNEAMAGCELVFHTASPFTTVVKDPQKELIDPAVKGTENVLESANQTPSVKRVVVTSSCAAIYTDAIDTVNAPGGRLTEKIWNTTASLSYQPYSYSKTLAEQKAWEIAKRQTRWNLVTINPCLILGPAMNPKMTTSESINLLKMFANGDMKMGVPKMGTGIVDVRDVAEAHFKAGFTPAAQGRYITAGHNTDFLQISKTLLPKFGDRFPLPTRALPKTLLMLVGPLANPLFSRKFIRNNVNIPWNADTSKIKNELQMTFRPMKETLEDSFQALVDEKIIAAK